MFKCDRCGMCCRNIRKSELYKELDDGTGKCKYLNGNLCSIYNNRPTFCKVDECYDLYFKDIMTKEEYYEQNYKACNSLKKSGGV
ncbi:YkgJ family cysteine cluster protein [uncultured Ruminococcus sp.]|uniref:YkgJ family cysteine cluster protein n=1 Tax=uncultured Ruminococcus sp. TaxID=165186 RepID=UPI0034A0573D